ncbi:MAG: PDZ domain-containing protein [Firmicutes bacterium]|jgi:serine protease Do|nr:PDZ domain-containing protein [Bacillota bacterium]
MERERISCLKLLFYVLAVIVILGCLAGVIGLKLHYDSRIAALAQQIEALQALQSNDNIDRSEDLREPGTSYLAGTVLVNVPEIAQKARASVVGIRVTALVRTSLGWFGSQLIEQPSEGSGIIYSSDGYIITNYHVVENYINSAKGQLEVFLADGRSAVAEYIGGDEQNDLAVIKIDLDKLPVASFGSSSNLRIGEFAMAIGNPLGMDLAGSVTVGVISGIDRRVQAENVAEGLIQTDAAINPGNSGGALVNAAGEVIGINTIKIATTAVEGIGFAIPIDFALPIVDSIIEHGYVKGRPAIGIKGSEINALTARFYQIPQGILIVDILEGSAAEKAGLKVNDIIVELDGQTVDSMSALNKILKQHRAGDTISLKYYRDGKTISTTLTLMEDRGEW